MSVRLIILVVERYLCRPGGWTLWIWLMAWPAFLEAGGNITGTVELASFVKAPPVAPRYVGGGMQPDPQPPSLAIIYLEGSFPEPWPPAPPIPPQMIQKGLQFVPAVLAVRKGGQVGFPNRDDLHHNVFSYSAVKTFDLGRYTKDEDSPLITFETAGVVKIFCEVHSHMRGTILVLDTPYFTASDPLGRYRLEDLPSGSWVLKAWIGEKQILSRSVTIVDGQTLQVDFTGP